MLTIKRFGAAAVLAAVSVLTACSAPPNDVSGGDGAPADEQHVAKSAAALSTDTPTGLTNVAIKHPTSRSTALVGDASFVVNGTYSDGNTFMTNFLPGAWWAVDLGYDRPIEDIDVFTSMLDTATQGATIELLDASNNVVATRSLSSVARDSSMLQRVAISPAVTARKVRITDPVFGGLSLTEVRVFARLIPESMFPITRVKTANEGICWKKSSGRGAGTIPTSCGAGQEHDGALCYPGCAAGYDGVGPVCWQTCPSGYTDTGAFCHRNGDLISADNSSCHWYDECGLTLDKGCSTCPPGYHNDGCTCRIDPSDFAKSTYTRSAGTLPVCAPDKQQQAGLCYDQCSAGYDGVGPVCWGQCNGDYSVACGAACATSTQECETFFTTIGVDVGQMIVNLSLMAMSFGESAEAISVAADGAKVLGADQAAAVQSALMTELMEQAQGTSTDVLTGAAQTLTQDLQTGEIDWTQLDPTGIATVVRALNQPTCK